MKYTRPVYIFFLIMPMGISQGFVTVTLPFLLTKSGFPVAVTAGIVAIGLSANLWRFAWGPVVDLSLSLHKWYWLSLLACIAGTGIGGGACLWLATHYNLILAGIALCAASIFFAMVMLLTQDIPYLKEKTIAHEVKGMSRDILAMIKSPVALFAMVLIIMPIGTGAMANIWSAVAEDWKTDADTVVLVTGLLCGGVSAVGCIAGGFIADRWGVWNAYLGIGIICALVTFLIALFPYLPATYISGVLVYGFCTGLIYAAYTAVILL